MPSPQHKYTLYSYFRSSCSARIRIAAHLKNIPLEYRYIHLVKGEQHGAEYTALNPSESVPTLVVTDVQTSQVITKIRQSVAILEFLEESRPDLPKLLPGVEDTVGRARVRELVNIVACDIQPVTNLRVLNFIKPLDIEAKTWQLHFMAFGFRAYEELLKSYAGKYSVGDELTLADCALAPAIDGALRFGVDVPGEFPHVWKVWENLKVVEAFKKGRWNNQEDTPEDLKVNE
ncbi:maleylacetoacetate isomerase [Rhinocladiella mackenziei CBS 650.93]|uniref:Maleylacetoacetate isomerase n=1 Tax=Rhinocladiella mackenziei CBS 650.93 TaxID=1442369 RepID=A0A0D2ISQ1_9EURO|nr:maleylacetoacetate isomerase [Rhinocladiella mackenziei CBS 650.93]KIX08994.1 maleylacetoacetate isomerase [Rhinocladiella mackenziei CBS 650.93]